MTVWDLVAVVVTVCVIVTMAVLLLILVQLISVLKQLRSAADRLADQALPAVDDLRETVDHADIELQRLQGVVQTAEEASKHIGSFGRSFLRAASVPFIKLKAISAGAKSGFDRIKNGGRNSLR
tara:strand:+ start:8825 stop:9196 length:372 start_codon:yes stop_codon:yes gene_type:complete